MNIDEILKKHKNVPFVKRILEQDIRRVDNIPSYGDYHGPSYSTHLLGYYTNDDGTAIVVPQVQDINGKLQRLDLPPYNDKAVLYNALENGDYIKFNSEKEAADFTRNYKNSKAWKQFENLLLAPKGQDGLKSYYSTWFYDNFLKPSVEFDVTKNPRVRKEISKYPDRDTKLNSTSSIHAERIKNDGRFDSRMNWDNMDVLMNFFNKYKGYKKTLGINANIAPESFAIPDQKQIGGGPSVGFIQLDTTEDRYHRVRNYPIKVDAGFNEWGNRQANYINDATEEKLHYDDWTHGGKGTGYNESLEPLNEFNNPSSTVDQITKAFMLGFVRPQDKSEKAIRKRQHLAHSLDSIYNPRFYKENQ